MFSFENYPNLLPFQFQGWQTDIFLSSYLLYSLAPVPLWSATLPPTSVASSTSKTASTPSHLLLWAQVFPVPESKPCVFHRTFQSCVELDLQQIGFYYILCLLYSIYLLFILYLLYSIIQTLCAIFQNAKSTQSCLDLSFWMAFNSASAPIDIQQSLSVWFESHFLQGIFERCIEQFCKATQLSIWFSPHFIVWLGHRFALKQAPHGFKVPWKYLRIRNIAFARARLFLFICPCFYFRHLLQFILTL